MSMSDAAEVVAAAAALAASGAGLVGEGGAEEGRRMTSSSSTEGSRGYTTPRRLGGSGSRRLTCARGAGQGRTGGFVPLGGAGGQTGRQRALECTQHRTPVHSSAQQCSSAHQSTEEHSRAAQPAVTHLGDLGGGLRGAHPLGELAAVVEGLGEAQGGGAGGAVQPAQHDSNHGAGAAMPAPAAGRRGRAEGRGRMRRLVGCAAVGRGMQAA